MKENIVPHTVMVLIKPRKIGDSHGRILYPKSVREREQSAVTEGQVIAKGPDAFQDYIDNGPEIGAWVAYAQYSGFTVISVDDRKEYLLMNDQDIKATLTKGPAKETED